MVTLNSNKADYFYDHIILSSLLLLIKGVLGGLLWPAFYMNTITDPNSAFVLLNHIDK